ncbi:MAG TPA: CBS domain-containing protein [Stellaceae bacterium]|nr:CBS domain-containing protein [Stellaceae bacterium]
MLASDVMTRDLVSIRPDAPVREAIRLMLDNKVSGLPVIDTDGQLAGVLTEGDLLRRSEIATERHHWRWLELLLGPGRLASEYVRTHGRVVNELMTREVITVATDMPLEEIVALMERHRIKRLPVVDASDTLVGIVSRADLLAALGRALDARGTEPASDEEIHARVLAELERTDWAPREGLTVTVTDGVVELDGVVLDEHERGALRVAAENVPGVKGVLDRLVWVEPVSGTVVEGAQQPRETSEAGTGRRNSREPGN